MRIPPQLALDSMRLNEEIALRQAAIVATARTPIGRAHRGALNNVGGATLGAHVVGAAVERAGIDPAEVYELERAPESLAPDTRCTVTKY